MKQVWAMPSQLRPLLAYTSSAARTLATVTAGIAGISEPESIEPVAHRSPVF